MKSAACLNGEMMAPEEAKVSVWDRGFLFGDAIYEVFRVYQGRCWLEDSHYERLERSLAEVEIEGVDIEAVRLRVRRTIAASGVAEGTVYLHLTRGVAPRKHTYPDPPVPPTELIVVRPFDVEPARRMRREGAQAISRPDLRWGRCDIKTTNLLPNVMAQEAAKRAGCYEAILYDERGMVTEATHTSLVWVRGGRLEGTPEGPEILPSTTRRHLLTLAEEIGVPFAESTIALDDLRRADEAILVGTTCEVTPLTLLDGRPIANAAPGPICVRLQQAYQRGLERWLAQPPSSSSSS